jgi:hypothetical protein
LCPEVAGKPKLEGRAGDLRPVGAKRGTADRVNVAREACELREIVVGDDIENEAIGLET